MNKFLKRTLMVMRDSTGYFGCYLIEYIPQS